MKYGDQNDGNNDLRKTIKMLKAQNQIIEAYAQTVEKNGYDSPTAVAYRKARRERAYGLTTVKEYLKTASKLFNITA